MTCCIEVVCVNSYIRTECLYIERGFKFLDKCCLVFLCFQNKYKEDGDISKDSVLELEECLYLTLARSWPADINTQGTSSRDIVLQRGYRHRS